MRARPQRTPPVLNPVTRPAHPPRFQEADRSGSHPRIRRYACGQGTPEGHMLPEHTPRVMPRLVDEERRIELPPPGRRISPRAAMAAETTLLRKRRGWVNGLPPRRPHADNRPRRRYAAPSAAAAAEKPLVRNRKPRAAVPASPRRPPRVMLAGRSVAIPRKMRHIRKGFQQMNRMPWRAS